MREMATGIGISVATLGSMVLLGYVSLALFAVATGRPVLSPAWRPMPLVRRSRLYRRWQLGALRRQVDQAFSEAEAERRAKPTSYWSSEA